MLTCVSAAPHWTVECPQGGSPVHVNQLGDLSTALKSLSFKAGFGKWGFVIGSIVACETSFEISARWLKLGPAITGF